MSRICCPASLQYHSHRNSLWGASSARESMTIGMHGSRHQFVVTPSSANGYREYTHHTHNMCDCDCQKVPLQSPRGTRHYHHGPVTRPGSTGRDLRRALKSRFKERIGQATPPIPRRNDALWTMKYEILKVRRNQLRQLRLALRNVSSGRNRWGWRQACSCMVYTV